MMLAALISGVPEFFYHAVAFQLAENFYDFLGLTIKLFPTTNSELVRKHLLAIPHHLFVVFGSYPFMTTYIYKYDTGFYAQIVGATLIGGGCTTNFLFLVDRYIETQNSDKLLPLKRVAVAGLQFFTMLVRLLLANIYTYAAVLSEEARNLPVLQQVVIQIGVAMYNYYDYKVAQKYYARFITTLTEMKETESYKLLFIEGAVKLSSKV